MKIAITGARGFLGKKLCESLRNKKYKLIQYDIDNFDLRKEIKLPKGIDVLYHLAALNKPYLSKSKPFESFQSNVFCTVNLLEAARKAGVKKIIFTSSVLVYKDFKKTKETDPVGYNGTYPYSLEKLIGEEYIKMYAGLFGIDYVIFRITGIYGPGMYKNPIYDMIQGFLNDRIKLYVNKNSIYNFIYIEDVVDALIKSLKWKNNTFNLSSDKNIKISELYKILNKKIKKNIKIEDSEFKVEIFGNNDKLKRTGWRIKYSLDKGLREVYNYLIKQKK